MNVNIYLEDDLGDQLNQWAKKTGKSRNMIIREAIREWGEHHETETWPSSVLEFKGIKDMPSFESTRHELLPPEEDFLGD